MKYRGRQLHQFLYKTKGVDFNDLLLCTHHAFMPPPSPPGGRVPDGGPLCLAVPKQFRAELGARGFAVGRMPVHRVVAAPDGTAKMLLRLDDSRVVEAVGIPAEGVDGKQRLTACVSSQVGCPLRCSFCATGKGGFARNLRPHEMVGQVLALEELFAGRVSNVVFMGMGEPLLNLPALTSALRCLNKELGIGQRQITVSTVGVPNTIRRLAEQRLQVTLAISLHAPNQRLREQLVPSARAYPLEALLEDCVFYFKTTGRRVSFEYTLLAAVNDQPEHAAELAALLQRWGLGRHVNIIPYNPIQDSEYRRPSKAYVSTSLTIPHATPRGVAEGGGGGGGAGDGLCGNAEEAQCDGDHPPDARAGSQRSVWAIEKRVPKRTFARMRTRNTWCQAGDQFNPCAQHGVVVLWCH